MLRKEFAIGRPEHVPDAPTHESLLAAATGDLSPEPEREEDR